MLFVSKPKVMSATHPQIKYNPVMAGKIPSSFIDDLMQRVDIVDVIDQRVPLTRKGKEYMACCPFHEEKTPSFTVSPSKQFYHCFGCGAHGTAIGFLMDYANLGFVEAVEELADGVGLAVPQQSGPSAPTPAGEGTGDLLKMVESANKWFQTQLRNHAHASEAVDYLKKRGLDGKTAADFAIGFAPDSWSDLADALGSTSQAQTQLVKAGLINKKEAGRGDQPRYYDRFRGRIIFPIEDHRGRVVGFGGRILGDGEPKYLNSPETPLFHKGSELYGLHRARRAIAAANKSIVVEGYMDVVSLAQFEIDHSVATLGTATTRTHLQRLFRLAPEVVFCFDGDRAGRTAAWKAMQVSLAELQDGRQIGFLFLAEGEDPDTTVRQEGKEAFLQRVDEAVSLPDFLFDSLVAEVDMKRMDGKARLVSLAKPLLSQLPKGVLREMMYSRLSSLSGLSHNQLESNQQTSEPNRFNRRTRAHNHLKQNNLKQGQLSPLAFATSLLLQNPNLGATIEQIEPIKQLTIRGSETLVKMAEMCAKSPDLTTARVLEAFRDSPHHGYLEKLAMRQNYVDQQVLEKQFSDTLDYLLGQQGDQRVQALLEKARQNRLEGDEKQELNILLKGKAGNIQQIEQDSGQNTRKS